MENVKAENSSILKIREQLAMQTDEKTKGNAQSYFKEMIKVYGVRTAIVNRLAADVFLEIRPLGKAEIFRLCEELLQSDYNEEAFIACDWSYRLHGHYEASDFARFEEWITKYIDNWAKCDTLCNHTVGAFVMQFPEYLPELKKWAKSDNRWLRRAAAVTLIIPARKGFFLPEIFGLADTLLRDPDDLVQKGYGWMLKEASKAHLDEVYSYIQRKKADMPRTALRYAIEKMPENMRREAMSK